MSGWIKLHRSLLEWEWYDDVNVMRLFLHCILKANHKDKKHKGTLVLRGSFLTGFDVLSKETGLSVRQVRTALTKLESTSEVTRTATSKGQAVTVVNYNKYQNDDRQATSGATSNVTNQRQASDKPTTTNNKGNNGNNGNNENNVSVPHVHEPIPKSFDSSISSAGEPLPQAKMTMQQLMTKVNGLRPAWAKPTTWSHQEQRTLHEGVDTQMMELEDHEWDMLKTYLNTPLQGAKGFWQPHTRGKFCETFSDVLSNLYRWAEKTPHLQKQLKPKSDPNDELADFK